MLQVLEKMGNKRPILIITRSPNQYPNYKTSNEIEPINKYKGSVVVFDDMLGARNISQKKWILHESKTRKIKRLLREPKLFRFTETKQ